MKKKEYKALLKTIIFSLVYYYFMLPPLNVTAPFFWVSIFIIVIFYIIVSGIFNVKNYGSFDVKGNFYRNHDYVPNKKFKVLLILIGASILLIFAVNLIFSPFFNSKAFANRIKVIEDADFIEDVKPVDFQKLALLDKDSSQKLGDRVMGQLPELVSQFDVSNIYTQINYKEDIERVTPLEYADVFKYFTNRKKGITGYIKVDSVTGKATLEKLEKGMRYVPSAIFSEDLLRKLRFSYPTDIFGEITFEVDDNNKPYWIIPVISYKGIGIRREVKELIIFSPVDGTSKKYQITDIPDWVDHVYGAELIIEQVNDWGKYKNGFINSIFGQKGVVATTDGYNYLVMNNDVYMTTGITSAVRDESNIGFILTNLRTKETKFYSVPGAEEYSAMDSARGQVQQMNYTATFPILVNLNNKPTYIISLKDNAGLVKMYAFVDLVDYQKVTVSDSSKGIEEAAKNYLGGAVDRTKNQKDSIITIKNITNIMIDGTTYFYLTDTESNKYRVSIKVKENLLPFVKANDKLNVTYIEEDINQIIKIK